MNYWIVLIAIIGIVMVGIMIMAFRRFSRFFTNTPEEISDQTASSDILERVFNAMDIFIHVTDPETEKILFANDKFKLHFGLDDSIIGEYCWRIFREGRCDSCPKEQILLNPGEPVTWEEYKATSGRYYRTTARIIDWPDGKKVIFHYRIDINDEILAREMTESMTKLLRTVNNTAAILLQSGVDEFEDALLQCMGMTAECVDADRVYIWENYVKDGELYCTQIYEWSEGAKPQQGEVHTIDMPYRENGLEWNELLPKGQCVNGLVREMSPPVRDLLSAQGILSILVAPVFLQDRYWGFVGFDDCHRERVFSEDEEAILRSASLLLANSLLRNEMTRELHAAVKEAQAANRAKSEFLSRISHEMRTPMNAIIGMADIACKAEDAGEIQDCLKKVRDSADHLLGIISDVLDMSKIEAGKMELSETDFLLRDLLDQVAAVMDYKLNDKRQKFTVHVDENVPGAIISDKQRLAQVITNLLSNANKFTPEGGNIRLFVHKSEDSDDGCKLLFEVEDDGIGISENEYKRLFDTFEQADNTMTREHGGAGLGLSISQNLVSMMNGNIWVKSKPGEGSTFGFTITARIGTADKNNIQDEHEPNVDDIENIFSGKRMLLVDDVEINREILIALLDDTGISIDCAENGREAYDRYAANPGSYDLIFMDIHMPEMDGYEATGMIREMADPEARTIPIIAMTADVFNADIKRCLAAGMNDHVAKPLDMNIVMAKMKRYLFDYSGTAFL